jgi:cation-transporting P-type ATPase I
VQTALTGKVLGGLLAAVGSARYGQRKATAPGKTATVWTMVDGSLSAVRAAGRSLPPPSVHTPWHALDPDEVQRRLADLPAEPEPRRVRALAPVRRVVEHPVVRTGPVRADGGRRALRPAHAGAGHRRRGDRDAGESTDAILVGSVTVANALLSGVQRLRAETVLESLLLEQDVTVHREHDGGREEVAGSDLRLGDVVVVESGDVLAADARLLEAVDLEVDESDLTGRVDGGGEVGGGHSGRRRRRPDLHALRRHDRRGRLRPGPGGGRRRTPAGGRPGTAR